MENHDHSYSLPLLLNDGWQRCSQVAFRMQITTGEFLKEVWWLLRHYRRTIKTICEQLIRRFIHAILAGLIALMTAAEQYRCLVLSADGDHFEDRTKISWAGI